MAAVVLLMFLYQTVNLIPFPTARENLLIVDEIGPRTGRKAAARADQLLAELGLPDRAGNLPAQLSGGQKQRVTHDDRITHYADRVVRIVGGRVIEPEHGGR